MDNKQESSSGEADQAADLVLLALAESKERQLDFIKATASSSAQAEAATKLLLASRKADGFFDQLADQMGIVDSDTLSKQEETFQGQQFGAYKTQRLIGRGGMGTVYLATRTDNQFEQEVALKSLPPLFRSEVLQARFLQERQILASLNHPNIARLLDGGMAEDGTPFISMEYVDGLPITTYCDEHRLTIEERLRIFLQVCDGVEYAHNNLVIHRDLKPENILVSKDGSAKLLDFGIAKLIDGSENNNLTQAASQPMTLRYASPEILEGHPANTSSDVYSLGVLLFEMLCGFSPYEQNLTTEAELRKKVLTGDINPPTLALKASEPLVRERVSSQRQIDVQKLEQKLSGDLSDVIMASLRHSRAARYASVREFAEDIKRHLSDHPVSAKRATRWYVVSKFYRRNRLAVTAGATAVLALATITAMATLYGLENARQTVQISKERDRAEQIQSFLLSIFSLSSPNETKGRSVDLKELLDIGVGRVDKELASQPVAASELKRSIAGLYAELGLPKDGEALLRAALEQRENRQDGTDSANAQIFYAETMEQLAGVVEMSGRYDEALGIAREALALSKTLDDDATIALSSLRVARLLHLQGNLAAARPHYERTLASQSRLFGPESEEVIVTSMHYGSYLRHTGAYSEAVERLRWATEQSLARHGRLHLMTMSGYVNLGSALNEQNSYAEGEAALREALAISTQLVGADHPDNRYSIGHLTKSLVGQDKLTEAHKLAQVLLSLIRKHLGEDHPEYPIALNKVAEVLAAQGNYTEALASFTASRAGLRIKLPTSQKINQVSTRIAFCQRQLGNLSAARKEIDAALRNFKATTPTPNAATRANIAAAHHEAQLIAKAERLPQAPSQSNP